MGAPKVTHARNSLRGMLPMIWYDMTWHDMTWHNLIRKNVTLHDIELTAATSFFWPGWVFVPKCLKCIWRIIRSKCLLLAHERSRRKSCSLQFCKVDDSTSPRRRRLGWLEVPDEELEERRPSCFVSESPFKILQAVTRFEMKKELKMKM